MIGCCVNTDKLNIIPPCNCDAAITLPFVADVSGKWTLAFEFAGTLQRHKFDAVNGEPLVIPNKFNENYNHLFRLYKPNGTLFNDTCYYLQTIPTYCYDEESGTDLPGESTERVISGELTFIVKDSPDPENPKEVPTGFILQSDLLKGKDPWNVIIIGNTPLQWRYANVQWDKPGGEFDFTNYSELPNDTVITIPYNETVSD